MSDRLALTSTNPSDWTQSDDLTVKFPTELTEAELTGRVNNLFNVHQPMTVKNVEVRDGVAYITLSLIVADLVNFLD